MEEERRRKRECGCRILTNFLRRKVSLKKKRWKQDGFDLDLAFIGKQKRLIAMGYPTQGCESIYRNEMGETERFFEQAPGFAKSSVRVYNLCAEANRQYDSKYFDGQVVVYPFADHHACPLPLLFPRLPSGCPAHRATPSSLLACRHAASGHPAVTASRCSCAHRC